MAGEITRSSVLIVDDNLHMLRIHEAILRAARCRSIVAVRDPVIGLERMRQNPFDAIIVDLNMEPIDGIEFIAMVRKATDIQTTQIPIVVCSGHSEIWRIKAARDAGCNEFVAKPVSAENLLNKLNTALSKPRHFVSEAKYKGPDRRRTSHIDHEIEERRVQEH